MISFDQHKWDQRTPDDYADRVRLTFADDSLTFRLSPGPADPGNASLPARNGTGKGTTPVGGMRSEPIGCCQQVVAHTDEQAESVAGSYPRSSRTDARAAFSLPRVANTIDDMSPWQASSFAVTAL
ncbi:hypothetical protein [Micromonospora carbonacea]|uniref:hypothetical protein n=1 Tax=Micromonospora carbonacea TaxID=47853 RepID=UPI003D71CB4E